MRSTTTRDLLRDRSAASEAAISSLLVRSCSAAFRLHNSLRSRAISTPDSLYCLERSTVDRQWCMYLRSCVQPFHPIILPNLW
jgi:hypothetical protein